jgi:hypothetical protein
VVLNAEIDAFYQTAWDNDILLGQKFNSLALGAVYWLT